MPRNRADADDWDAAFDAAARGHDTPAAPQQPGRGALDPLGDLARPRPTGVGHDAFDGIDDLDALGDAFARLDAGDGTGERFRATFRKLTSGAPFSDEELSATLEVAAYSLTEMGELRVSETERVDAMTWSVVYTIVHPGPMAEMMAGPVGGVMAAWRGRMPIPQIGLIEAEGEYLG